MCIYIHICKYDCMYISVCAHTQGVEFLVYTRKRRGNEQERERERETERERERKKKEIERSEREIVSKLCRGIQRTRESAGWYTNGP